MLKKKASGIFEPFIPKLFLMRKEKLKLTENQSHDDYRVIRIDIVFSTAEVFRVINSFVNQESGG